jgi:hypothetical protein
MLTGKPEVLPEKHLVFFWRKSTSFNLGIWLKMLSHYEYYSWKLPD